MSFVITASARGELKAAWEWSDEAGEKRAGLEKTENAASAKLLYGNGEDIASMDSAAPPEDKKESLMDDGQ